MKKFLIMIVCSIMCFSLFGCDGNTYNIHNDTQNQSVEKEDTADVTYVVNMSSKIYHLPSCVYTKNIKDENREETKDLDALKDKGYVPCLKCIGG
jgi:methylphosphotriester-DNA--protein-cysteine methyltransferase